MEKGTFIYILAEVTDEGLIVRASNEPELIDLILTTKGAEHELTGLLLPCDGEESTPN